MGKVRRSGIEPTAELTAADPATSAMPAEPATSANDAAPQPQRDAPPRGFFRDNTSAASAYRQSQPKLFSGPAGAFFSIARAPVESRRTASSSMPTIQSADLDRAIATVLRASSNDTPILVSGVRLADAQRSHYAARIHTLDSTEQLLDYSGRRVLLLTPASFPEAFHDALGDSLIVKLEELDLRGSGSFDVHPLQPGRGRKRALEDPVFVETFAEFPKLLSTYLQEMEHLKSLLVLIRNLGKDPAKATLKTQLVAELESSLDRLDRREERIPGLPAMSLDDLKMNLAALITAARKERGRTRAADQISAQVSSLRRLLDQKHEFALPIGDDLPRELQKRIDKNNLVLASMETEARLALIDDVQRAIAPHADGVNVLGSASWGSYYEVKRTSDIDLEVMIKERDLAEFQRSATKIDFATLQPAKAEALLQTGRGRIFELLRSLVDKGYAPGDTKAEKSRAVLKQFAVFSELHAQKARSHARTPDVRPGHHGESKLTDRLGDYLAYKVYVGDVDLSIHFFPSETYARASELDLAGEQRTRLLSEVRVGQRKKVSPGKKEKTLEDSTLYPKKQSFDGRSLDYECDVFAAVKQNGTLELIKPSALAARGLSDADVLAWITDTPATVFEDGRMYHGLFQDKALWGELLPGTSPELTAAKDHLLGQVMRRYAAEVERGLIRDPHASILELSSRGERIPPYTKRNFLESLRDRCPEDFAIMRAAMERLGSDVLQKMALAERTRDPNDLDRTEAEHAEITQRARLGGASEVTALAERIEALNETKTTDKDRLFGKPDSEIIFMIKPLGMEQGVEDKVRKFILENGGRISGEWRGIADTRRIAEHYERHSTKPVFGDLVSYYAGQEVAVFRVKIDAEKIEKVRELLGNYKPVPGSLRDQLVAERWVPLFQRTGIVDNGLHISDSADEGAREAKIWFAPPEIVASRPETRRAHEFLYGALSRIDPSLQFAGSQYTGLAISAKADDLDYRLLADDVDRIAKDVARIPGVTFRREGVDHKSGQRFLLYEYKWNGGKADIAVVPKEHFHARVSASVLAKFLPEEWKADVRAIKERWRGPMEKAIAEHGHGSPEYLATKAEYEREKKDLYRTVKRYFGISQKSGELQPLPEKPIPSEALKTHLEALDQHEPGLAAQLSRVVDMVPQEVRGALLEHVFAFETPAPPPELQPAITAARAGAAQEAAALVQKHRAAFEEYRAPYVPLKENLDRVVSEVAQQVGGEVVLTSIKGERRGIARAILKGTPEEPNFYEIKDMVRSSIVVRTPAEVGPAVDAVTKRLGGKIKLELDRSGYIVKVPKNRFHRPVGGYYDYMLKADFGDRRQGEIQFHIPEMMVAKFLGKGHETYDLMRDIARLFDDPQYGEAAKKYYLRLDVAMRDYYGVVMEMARAAKGDGAEGTFLEVKTPYVDQLIEAKRRAGREHSA